MFSNTGTVSFVLYFIFILITIIAMMAGVYYIKKGSIAQEKLDRIIELFKYAIVTTAITTVTLIITDLFKEREQDVKELEYFDKYVNDVKKVDGIEERLLLAKYLSIVSPSGDLKKSWKNYLDTVLSEYQEYLLLKKEQLKIDTIVNPSEEQVNKSLEVQEKINQFEKPLASATLNTEESVEYYIIAGGDISIPEAQDELKKALKIHQFSAIIKKGNLYRTVLTDLFSRTDAEKILSQARKVLNSSSYIVKKINWCKSITQGTECLICN